MINFGSIAAVNSNGVDMAAGGTVTNGSLHDKTARISAYRGWAIDVRRTLFGAAATVVNFGAIAGALTGSTQSGVYLAGGGSLTNGAAKDTKAAVLAHGRAVQITDAATIANYGTIQSSASEAVFLGSGYGQTDLIANGTAKDTGALIQGATDGVEFGRFAGGSNSFGKVTNFGKIEGDGTAANAAGVYGVAETTVTNGTANDTKASIQGFTGARLDAGFVANFGTIAGIGATGTGLSLAAGGGVTNGSAADTKALIEGNTGVAVGYYGVNVSVTNFGTISGTGGTAVSLGDASDVLIVEAGCVFTGAVLGGGGTLDLDSGAGTLTGLLAGGTVTVSGSMAATTFSNFGTVEIGVAATFADLGAVSLAAGQSVIVAGALTLGAKTTTFANAGVIAALDGTVTVNGGLANGGALDVEDGAMTVTGNLTNSATVEAVGGSLAVKGALVNGGMLDTVDSAVTVTGSSTNSGTIEAQGGVVTMKGALDNTGTIETVGGTITVKGALTGAGQATINGGLIDCGSIFSQNVTFTGTAGTLELARSQAYAATIAGFSKSGGTFLDLGDIEFLDAGEATYFGTKTGGTLTVTDGTHTAHIALAGDYTTSTFVAASDGHGGTIVHDPAAATAAVPSPHRLIAAMAGLGAGGAGGAAVTGVAHDWPRMMATALTAPRLRECFA
ncbi:MAG: beta strand repeat-containing protein [Caulobacteraceae bacterium]